MLKVLFDELFRDDEICRSMQVRNVISYDIF